MSKDVVRCRTIYDRSRIYSNVGDPIHIVYGSIVDKQGNVKLERKGSENLYDFIQSFADSTDINILLSKFRNGDTTALNQRVGQYMDITNMPTSFAEVLDTVHRGEELFYALPLEVREKFNNNLNQFIADIGSDQWYQKLQAKESEEVKDVSGNSSGQE